MELAGGEAFLGGAVAGGAEGVEEAWGEIDFAGEEAARGFLATAIKIGHGNLLSVTLLHFGNAQTSLALRSTSATVLLELVMHRFEIFC